MRVAITVFGSMISPLFDTAQRLMLADVDDGDVRMRCEEEIGSLDLAQRIALLTKLGVTVLACGAISKFSRNALDQRGIEVYPWVSGEIEQVLDILAKRRDRHGEAESSIRLAIPATGPDVDAFVAPSFRRCSHILFVETGDMTRTGTRVANEVCGEGACYQLTKLIVEENARVLLTGRCGPNALGILAVAGVEVIQNVQGRVKDVVAAFAKGSLGGTAVG